ncbi:MAG: EVE domain-containing protein [Chloroflexi bacterium]|nr:EVE domain-containing protein [Chloroflexota bacterium]
MPRNYWMLVITPPNFAVTRQQGYTVQGFSTVNRKKVERMEIGDRLLYYVSGVQRFPASATITSTFFVDQTPLWRSHRPEEAFAHRVRIKAEAVIEEEADYIDARDIAPSMEYVKRWIPEQWPLAFFGELHLIPRKDFSLIEDELNKIVGRYRRGLAAV